MPGRSQGHIMLWQGGSLWIGRSDATTTPHEHHAIQVSLALALHVADEALTGFLSFYNPMVESLRSRFGWWPMPTFEFGPWLGGLIVAVILLSLLARFAFEGRRWVRPLAYQGWPDAALPDALKNNNPLGIWRMVNNELTQGAVK